jgi:hypothetical protein
MHPVMSEKLIMRAADLRGRSSTALTIALRTLLWGYVVVTSMASLSARVDEFDDAIPLLHGMLVQQGRIPHLDFSYFYPPLGLYLNAVAFSLLGRTVVATRVVGILLYILVLLLTERLFQSRFPQSRPLVPAAVLLVAASIGSALNVAVWPGFAFSLITLLAYLCLQSGKGNRRLGIGISGILTGLALLYRVNFGAYVAVVILIDLLLQWWFSGEERWRRHSLKNVFLDLVAYTVPLVVCCVGFCLWIYGGNISAGVYQFTVNTQKIMYLRGFIILEYSAELVCALVLPFGWFSFRILKGKDQLSAKALIPIIFAVVILGLAIVGHTHPSIAGIVVALELACVVFLHLWVYRLEQSEFCVLLFFCLLLHYYLARADLPHWRILPIVESMLVGFLVFSRFDWEREEVASPVSRGTALAVLGAAVCLLLAASDFRPAAVYMRNGPKVIASLIRHPRWSDTERVLGPAPPAPVWASIYSDPDELQALRYMRKITGSNDPIFVGVKDHSRVFLSNLRIYWLAGRPIGTRVFQLETRVATEPDVQQGIIADLERNGVKCVILDMKQLEGDDTFRQIGYVGSTLLDEYIAGHFHEEARFGKLAVLTRVKH